MAIKIEVEQKFFCKASEELINELINQGFKIDDEVNEIDEYFTDIDCEYVRTRTCLRIRKKNNNKMELTFKGKSQEYGSVYAKSESDIELNISEYKDVVNTLKALGYYSYSIVCKERKTYQQKKENRIYNVMIDEVINIGSFVEFEILCEDIDCDTDYLKKELNDFVNKFERLHLEPANLPYRDFVALHLYQEMLPVGKIEGLIINLDSLLMSNEKLFLDFQECINKLNISNKNKEELIMEYKTKFRQLILKQEVLLNFELLRRIKKKSIKLGLVTTISKEMIDILIDDLKLDGLFEIIMTSKNIEDISNIYRNVLDKIEIKMKDVIIIESSNNLKKLKNNKDIKTIYIDNDFSSHNKEIMGMDCFSRVALLLINYSNSLETRNDRST